MLKLSIDSLQQMSRQDADALRAIAEVYHPYAPKSNVALSDLRAALNREAHDGAGAAHEILRDLNQAARGVERTLDAVEQRKHATVKFYRAAGAGDMPPAFEPGDAYYSWQTGTVDFVPVGWSITPAPLEAGQILYCAAVALGEPVDTSASPLRLGAWNVAAASFNVGNLASMGTAGTLTVSGTISDATGSWSMDANGKVEAPGGMINGALGAAFLASAQATGARTGATAKVHELHPHDNPAAGAPDAADVFSGGGITMDATGIHGFAGPNGPISLTVADYPFSGATDADVAAGFTADPAQVFSGGAALPNVASGSTPIPPPLPIVTGQTLPLPSGAVPIVSPPPPPPPAPVPGNVSGAAPTTNGVQVDAAGLPWDGRIHASTKTRTAKDVWTRRRGVEDTVVAEVEAQLRAAMAIPVPLPSPVELPHIALTAQDHYTPVTIAAPTFPVLMQFITERIATKRLTQEQVQAAVQAVGLESINLVMARADLVPAVLAELRKVAP